MVKFLKKIGSTEAVLQLRENFFFASPATKLHFLQAMERYKNCDNIKNPTRIKEEITISKKYWNCYPYHYFINNLFMAENDISEEEIINYIPHFFWFKLFLPHYFSPKFSMIGANKIIMEHFFKAVNINRPEPAFILFNGILYNSDMEYITFHQAQSVLGNDDHGKLFVKPAEESGGRGIYVFSKNHQYQYVTKQNVHFNEDFLTAIGKKSDYIIQPGIVQDTEFSRIYPDSVNTCRIITENKNGTPRVVCAMLRMGRNHTEVDNISSGGISTHVNIQDGMFGDFAISYQGEKFERHPDTQFIFRNNKISRWSEVKKFVTECAGKLPFFTYIGWDISLTPDGPVAIEINTAPAIDIIEMTDGGLREAFGIDDPRYYWKNPGKRI